jgi:glycosyltransferase involved in cell wall biosynthesis
MRGELQLRRRRVTSDRRRREDGAADQPLRVVFVNHVARLSGGEIALERLLAALKGSVAAHVILGEDGPLVERLRAAGAQVEVIPVPPSIRDMRKESITPSKIDARSALGVLLHVWRLRRRIRELEPDLVHTNSLKAALYGGLAGRLAGVRVVWHIRDRIAEDYLPRAAVRLVRVASRVLPTAVIANSKTTLATLPQRRGHVLYGIVTDPLVPPSFDPRPGPELTIGMVGRISRWKGQHVFLEAFAHAFRALPVRGRIIGSVMFGEEAYEAEIRSRADELGLGDQIEFRGFGEDVWAELVELDILVHCSITPEPFGQVVVEGMAAGLPVVAAAAGGPAEVIQDGIDGLLTPPGDADELARTLRRVADDPELRRRLGTRARIASRSFSGERTADELMGIYDQILGLR